MNYGAIMFRILKNGLTRNAVSDTTHKHHIFPRCLFGDNDHLVVLTVKEHRVVHKCLAKMFPDVKGFVMAANMMSGLKKGPRTNYVVSEKTRAKISATLTGHKHTEVSKQKMSDTHKQLYAAGHRPWYLPRRPVTST
jgi:hypothetical protein